MENVADAYGGKSLGRRSVYTIDKLVGNREGIRTPVLNSNVADDGSGTAVETGTAIMSDGDM